MIYINEWLPNPTGQDTKAEWIELYNSGSISVNLSGWHLQTKNGKTFSLGGYNIGEGGYLVLPRTTTKLALHNFDETISLFDNQGHLVDSSTIFGTAQEGKSWSRISYSDTGIFGFANPTPGALNSKPNTELIVNHYPIGQALNNPSINNFEIVGLALGSAALITAFLIFAFIKNDYLQELFFYRN